MIQFCSPRLIRALLPLLLVFAAPHAGAVSVDTSDILGSRGAGGSDTSDTERLGDALDLLGAGRAADAEAMARRAIDRTPESAAAHEVLGAALALQDRVPEAIAALERAIEINPRQHTAWTKLGDIASALGDEEKAVSFYRRALKIAPDDRLSNQRVGLYLARHGEIGAAIRHLEKGLVGAPDDYLGVRVDLAGLQLRAGHPDRALDVLARWEDRAAQGAPVPAAALRVLGEAQLANGEPAAAAERFRAVLHAHAEDVPALLGLGRAERALGRPEASIEMLARAAAVAPADPAPQIELAASEAIAGQGAAAEARLDRLVAPDRQPEPAMLAQAARLYGAMGIYDKARDGFARAIEEAPGDANLRAGMTAVLMRLGDNAGALDQARIRLELTPSDPDAAFQAGMLQEAMGDRTDAAASYQQALGVAPEHWPSLNNLAVIRMSEGRTADALDLALEAAMVAPENPTVLDTLANIYAGTGDSAALARTRQRIAEIYLAAGRIADAREALRAAAAAAPDAESRARITALLESL